MSAPLLLRGVDLAAFAVALVARLRGGGVVVSASGSAEFVHAMRAMRPSRERWTVMSSYPGSASAHSWGSKRGEMVTRPP